MIEEHTPEKHINSIRYALNGLAHALSTQRNFRLQILLALIVMLAAWFFGFDRLEWAITLLAIGLILTAELANTVLETLVDISSPALAPKAKLAKDLSAGAVLVIALFSLMVGLLLFVPHLRELLGI